MRTLVVAFAVAGCWTSTPPATTPPPAAPPAKPPQPASAEPQDPVELGKLLFQRKGCVSCHTVDGSPKVGPSWRGIWDTDVKLDDGRTAHIDDAYIRRSILTPTADTVAGFPPGAMPSFDGHITDREIEGIVAYIRSLR